MTPGRTPSSSESSPATLVELLHRRAASQPDRVGYTFLGDDGAEQGLTYGELDRQARAVAVLLQERLQPGDRVLLLYQPGLEYLAALFGSLYAGVLAVPAYPPRPRRPMPRLQAVAEDAGARAALTTRAVISRLRPQVGETPYLAGLDWLPMDRLPDSAGPWLDPGLSGESLAFLQYTSGSTTAPRGVMLSHANLLDNLERMRQVSGVSPADHGVFWLPPYHDMGLIGGVLAPLYAGFPVTLMSPAAFLHSPALWLETISRVRGTCSAAPNFAYDLCVRQVTPEQRAGLDLSSWRLAVSGAEPVRAVTMERFAAAFRECGFRPEAFLPSYGLAEATLMVSGTRKPSPESARVRSDSLERNRVEVPGEEEGETHLLVGCGTVISGHRAVIVHPERRTPCAPDEVGEIWLSGPSVARGYWNRRKESEATFGERLKDGEGPFLRTGDLGFLRGGELFVTGRLKDMILIRGRNHYPQDIERTVEEAHPALRPACGAAFSVSIDGEERLIVVHEVERHTRKRGEEEIEAAVRRAVAEHHGLHVHALVLLRPGSIPKTSSGKIQRHACKANYLADCGSRIAVCGLGTPLAEASGLSEGADHVPADAPIGSCKLEIGDSPPTHPHTHTPTHDPIAVVGLGCRLPGAEDPESFWQLLREGRDAFREVPPDRWDIDAFYDPDPAAAGKIHSRWGGFLPAVDRFDPHFFKLSPREADRMDPQQRLLLEVTWEALGNAGMPPDRLAGSSTGVFVGISSFDYSRLPLEEWSQIDAYMGTGNAHSIAANRISYLFDFHGPSFAVDTACSSALVAVHLACRSLREGECNLAVAGGVNLILTPELSITFSKARMLSAGPRCRTFDAAADGFLRGEGCGVVVLKRLSDAIRDGDEVLALIRGSAVNQDGRTPGISAPSAAAQEAVIRAALADAGVAPREVGYVEAHGTATPLGDPVEVQALAAALSEGREAGEKCLLASAKTNIGHLEAAAGIAGLIKLVLALRNEELPPHLHLERPNPALRLEETPLEIVRERRSWRRGERRRVAGVSSFGFGGTNAHVVLEEAPLPVEKPPVPERPTHLLALSAHGEAALREAAGGMAARLRREPEAALPDLCYSANTGAAELPHRLGAAAVSGSEMAGWLERFAAEGAAAGVTAGKAARERPRVAWLFTGQGAQYGGMGHSLWETQPVFREALAECEEILRPHLPEPLTRYLYPADGEPSHLEETWLTQPALFAVEWALARLWRSWGVEPDAVMGHSLGEYVAAAVAGALSLEDALRLVAVRGRLIGALPRDGAMAAVRAAPERVVERLSHAEELSVAAYNGPELVVLSGRREALEAVTRDLAAEGVICRPLQVSHAFHSALMEPMLPEFEAALREVRFAAPAVPLVSNLTGEYLEGAPDIGYWLRHVREPVRFEESIRFLSDEGFSTFLEVGPAPTLCGMARRVLTNGRASVLLPSLVPAAGDGEADDWGTLLNGLAHLHTLGVPIDWRGFDRPYLRRRVFLPPYPFERRRCWAGDTPGAALPNPERPGGREADGVRGLDPRRLHPLLDGSAPAARGTAALERRFRLEEDAVLREHRVGGRSILPGAAFLEMGLAAARSALGRPAVRLENVQMTAPLAAGADGTATARVEVDPAGETPEKARFRILSCAGEAEASRLLEIARPGTFTDLRLRPHERRPPGPGEIEIGVRAAGLNFMDVLKALALYPGLPDGPVPLGGECAGVVTAVGEGVSEVRVGDAVVAVAQPAFGTYAIAAAHAAVRKPEALTFEEAATVPIAFLTAHYALNHLGHLSAGERLLIHSAAGGVGLAAIQLAQAAGAEVFATAGSEEKREHLRGLGVRHVMDSRTLEFVEEVRRLTDGRGVDVVLNFLAGEAMSRSLECLARHGRFLEIGRTVLYGNEQLGLYPFRNNLSYFAIDMNLVCRERGDLLRTLYRDLMGRFERGDLRPLPLQSFPAEQAENAFRLMAARKHIGKIVLTFGGRPETTEHAKGEVSTHAAPVPEPLDLRQLSANLARHIESGYIYGLFASGGLEYGPYFRSIRWLKKGEDRFLSLLQLPPEASPDGPYLLHPSLLDGVMQSIGAALVGEAWERGERDVYVPFAVRSLQLFGEVPARVYCLGSRAGKAPQPGQRREVERANVTLAHEDGRVVAVLEGVFLKRMPLPAAKPEPVPGPVPEAQKEILSLAIGWFHQVRWKPAPFAQGEAPALGVWLVLTDEGGVGKALVRRLRAAGHRCITVAPGRGFRDRGAAGYALEPGSLEQWERLSAKLRAKEVTLSGVIHLWSCDRADSPEAGLERGVHSLLGLTRSLGAGCGSLWLVTRGAQAAGVEPPVSPEGAALWGMGRVVPKELPRVYCAGVDLEPGADADAAAEVLVAELCGARPREGAWVAYRAGERLAREVVPLDVSEAGGRPLPIKDGGAYLITGGQSGIGLEMARWIAGKVRARLALVNRTLPDELQSPERARGIRELEALGAEVLPLAADIADPKTVAAAIGRIEERWGRVDGVIHAAGVLRDGLLAQMDREQLDAVLWPKARGARVLDEALGDRALDFFLLCSSISSLMAPPGQANYAAANAYLDAYAHARRREGRPILSLNWGPWGETGMAASERHRETMAAAGIHCLTKAEGVAGLAVALRLDLPQAAFYARADDLRPAPALRPDGGNGRGEPSGKALSAEALEERVRERIVRYIAGSLQTEPERISVDRGFLDLGLDSLMAVEIIGALKKELEIPLSPTMLFEYPTIDELAQFVAREYPEELGRRMDGASPEPAPAAPREAPPVAVAPAPPPALVLAPPPTSNGTGPHAVGPPAEAVPAASPAGRGAARAVAQYRESDIAIVGMACNFPGAPDVARFWELLRDGRDAIREIPAERWDWRALHADEPGTPGKSACRWGGFLEGIDRFDPEFFGLSRREAALIDPQQRLLLETAWAALEHAGCAPDSLAGTRTGVWVGCTQSHQYWDRIRPLLTPEDEGAAVANHNSFLANRLSYFFNLRGPSLVVDTMSSSSLVAVHAACESLRRGECEAAVVGGVSLLLSPQYYVTMSEMRALSPDGRPRPFDAVANGMVPGEGVGVLLLKPLGKALENRDTVYAVLRGSAVNHRGRSGGLLAPSPRSGAEAILAGLESGELEPGRLGYVETDGTGNPVPDSVEAQALAAAFRGRNARFRIGSLEPNVGHLEAAGGIARLIKAALCLRHRTLPPTLGFERVHPLGPVDDSIFQVNVECLAWKSEGPLRAGVHNVGMGGVEAFAVLEEAPPLPAGRPERAEYLLPLSARTPAALKELMERYARFLQENPAVSPEDLCFTAATGRAQFPLRQVVLGRDADGLGEALHGVLCGVARLAEGELTAIAGAYERGEVVDWRQVYPQGWRIALPGYPFSRERCWVEGG